MNKHAPAYPVPGVISQAAASNQAEPLCIGLSKRENVAQYIACHLVSSDSNMRKDPDVCAKTAVSHADALLSHLEDTKL